jgi:hypothetical protein
MQYAQCTSFVSELYVSIMAWFHFVFVLTFFGGIAAGKLTYQVGTEANPKVFAKFRVDIFNETMNVTME